MRTDRGDVSAEAWASSFLGWDVYYDGDADRARLGGRTFAIIGYGSQGHAHALNLKDSGVSVKVGLPATSRSPHHTGGSSKSPSSAQYTGRAPERASSEGVAARSGVAKTSLYRHFRTKDDLIAWHKANVVPNNIIISVSDATQTTLPQLTTFANGLTKDRDAVIANGVYEIVSTLTPDDAAGR